MGFLRKFRIRGGAKKFSMILVSGIKTYEEDFGRKEVPASFFCSAFLIDFPSLFPFPRRKEYQ
jgi:hypothetical protein